MTAEKSSIKNCARCNLSFVPIVHHQIYCSDDCRKKSVKEINISLSEDLTLKKVCFTCRIEKPISEYYQRYTAQYGVDNHCKECQKKKYRKKTYGDNQTTKCEHCGIKFKKENKKKFCSKRCKRSYRTVKNGGIPKPDISPKKANSIIDGMRVCTVCEESKSIETEFYWFNGIPSGVCKQCRRDRSVKTARARRSKPESKTIRQQERLKAAEKKGIEYIPLEIRKEITLLKNSNKPRNARIILKKFLAESTDEEISCWYAALGKPWLNPRLSDTEKRRIQYKFDPDYAVKERMRRQIKKASSMDGIADLIREGLKRNGKSSVVEESLGYTITELREHIGRQFTKGMTWDKFMKGEIHIDHIVPKNSFNLSDYDEWRSCWSLPNLRPMWAKDNLAKSAKITHLL